MTHSFTFAFLAEFLLAFIVATTWRKRLVRAVASVLIVSAGILVIVGIPLMNLTGGPSGEEQLGDAILSIFLLFGGILATATGLLAGHFAGKE